ncbi:DUF1600 domain-containing protein [Mycoplasmoides pirum]|uniref:DUF1600 domain-containing protein n=1 Tax=Mycoplasmoides pirum TaxID=2122 RepID=UPI0004819B61|nr:DUF1600 domain-containing protein [Mycoplasmoides pirum]
MEIIEEKVINQNNWKKYFNFQKYNVLSWIHFIVLIISGVSPLISLAAALATVIETKNFLLIWFTNYDTFTYQSNLLISLYIWLSFWKTDLKMFKTHTLLMTLMVYIFVTFTFFNSYDLMRSVGKIPQKEDIINSNPNNLIDIDNLFVACSTWNHIINPIFFILYGSFSLAKENKPFMDNVYKYITVGMIYPLIYTLYLILIPWSGYLDNGANSYSVYGVFSQTKYNNLTWLWIPPLLAVFPISLTIIWNIKFHICKKETNTIKDKKIINPT